MVAINLRPAIFLLGDSLVQFSFGRNGQVGWGGLLSQAYQRRADVFNRGFQGYTTGDILHNVLPNLLMPSASVDSKKGKFQEVPVLFWVIFWGANDATLTSGRRRVSVDDFAQNVDQIVTTVRAKDDQSCHTDPNVTYSTGNGEVPIIFITPPPCDVHLWEQLYPDENVPKDCNEIFKTYADQVMSVAKRNTNCSVIDIWTLLGGDDPSALTAKGYQTDGVHLSEKGNRAVFESLMDVIKRDYPNMIPMMDGNGQFGKLGVPMEGKLWWMYGE